MNTYKLGNFNTDGSQNILMTDGFEKERTVPPTVGNKDYDKYLAWLAEGNTPEPAEEATE